MTQWKEVTKAEFFAAMGPLNVHPRPFKERSDWEMLDTRRLVGQSYPGYMCRGEERYLLTGAA